MALGHAAAPLLELGLGLLPPGLPAEGCGSGAAGTGATRLAREGPAGQGSASMSLDCTPQKAQGQRSPSAAAAAGAPSPLQQQRPGPRALQPLNQRPPASAAAAHLTSGRASAGRTPARKSLTFRARLEPEPETEQRQVAASAGGGSGAGERRSGGSPAPAPPPTSAPAAVAGSAPPSSGAKLGHELFGLFRAVPGVEGDGVAVGDSSALPRRLSGQGCKGSQGCGSGGAASLPLRRYESLGEVGLAMLSQESASLGVQPPVCGTGAATLAAAQGQQQLPLDALQQALGTAQQMALALGSPSDDDDDAGQP